MATILKLTSMTISQLFFEFFLPFSLTLVIMFAVLQMTRLFNRRINLIISLIVTIMVAATPLFSRIATLVSQFGSYTAMIAFILVFVIGISSWAFRKTSEYVSDVMDAERNLRKLYKKRAKLIDEIERTSNDNLRSAKIVELENIDRAIRTNEAIVRHRKNL